MRRGEDNKGGIEEERVGNRGGGREIRGREKGGWVMLGAMEGGKGCKTFVVGNWGILLCVAATCTRVTR